MFCYFLIKIFAFQLENIAHIGKMRYLSRGVTGLVFTTALSGEYEIAYNTFEPAYCADGYIVIFLSFENETYCLALRLDPISLFLVFCLNFEIGWINAHALDIQFKYIVDSR